MAGRCGGFEVEALADARDRCKLDRRCLDDKNEVFADWQRADSHRLRLY